MNSFEHHHGEVAEGDAFRSEAATAEEMLFAVDDTSAARYPYDDEDDADAFDAVGFAGDPLAVGGFESVSALMREGVDDVLEEVAVGSGFGDRHAQYDPRSYTPARSSRRVGEPSAKQIPGRNRVSYSTGSVRVTPARLRPIAHQEPSAMSVLLPFALFLTGTCGTVYFALLAGSPVLAGVSFTLGAIGAMFCRVLLRR